MSDDNCNKYIATNYLKYALEDYNKLANYQNNNFRPLTEKEAEMIIACMYYVFGVKTSEEAYDLT